MYSNTSYRSTVPYSHMYLRTEKSTGGKELLEHLERLLETYRSNPDIDPDKIHLSYCPVRPRKSLKEDAEKLISEVKSRKNYVSAKSNRMIMFTFNISVGLEDALGPDGIGPFFERGLEVIRKMVPPDRILCYAVHLDEKRPHAHVIFCPVTEDWHLSTSEFLAPSVSWRKTYCAFKTKFFDAMQVYYPFLRKERYEIEEGRRMVSPNTLKRCGSLDYLRNNLKEVALRMENGDPMKALPDFLKVANDILSTDEDARSAVYSTKDRIVSLDEKVKVLEYVNQKLQWLIEDASTVIKRHNRKLEKDFHWRDPDLELLCERMNNTMPYQDEPTVTKELERF